MPTCGSRWRSSAPRAIAAPLAVKTVKRLFCLLWLGLTMAAAAHAVDEDKLKAAIVYNLLGFVEWPAAATPPAGGELVLCLDAHSVLAAPLRQLVGRPVQTWRLDVRAIDPGRSAGCQALLIDATTRDAAMLVRARAVDPVLVITDRPRGPDDGAHIHLLAGDGRIGFDVNLVPARRSGLQFSARLLRLARAVRE